jgi:hypothetical protein
MPCPHCRVVGALIRHGVLRGYVSLTALWSHFRAIVAELASEVAVVLAPGIRQTASRATSLLAG